MKLSRVGALIGLSLLLTACLDHWYPNDLSGTIDNSVYTNHVRKGLLPGFDTYSIQVPQTYNSFQISMLKAEEKFAKDFTYVSFGPSASDHTIYRVMIISKYNLPMSSVEKIYFPTFIKLAAKDTNRHQQLLYQTKTQVNGRPATYKVYGNAEPDVYSYISPYQPNWVDLTHAVYFVDYGKYGVIFWITYHSDSSINQVIPKDRKLLFQQRFRPQNRFLKSFHIDEYKGRCCS